MKRILTITVLLVLVASVSWGARPDRGIPARFVEPNQVRGAWRVTQIPGEGGPPPFQMLMVFTRDGAVVETDAGPPNPLQFSPGLGEWKQNDGHVIASYTQLQYDSGQNLIGTFSALIDVTLDDARNTFGGTVRVRFYDLDQVLLFEGFGTVEGKRLPID